MWPSKSPLRTPVEKMLARLWRVSDCEELVGVTHRR